MGGYFKNKLTDLECKKSKCPIDKNFIYLADGFGLRLRVKKNSKAWIYRFRLNRKWHQMGFGVYPTVTLIDARNKREIAAKEVSKGLHLNFILIMSNFKILKNLQKDSNFLWCLTT